MGVSHRFRGIGFDCCYLDPADEDTEDTRGVPDLPRGFSSRLPRLAVRSIIPGREFATGTHIHEYVAVLRYLTASVSVNL